jgi:hypothetical protein
MNNCTIYNKSFLEDLENLESSINSCQLNFNAVSSLIQATAHENNTWTPLFINNTNTRDYCPYKLLSDLGYISGYDNNYNFLGIQDFLSLKNPVFNFWNVVNGEMVADWVLNNPLSSQFPVEGLLFWFKKVSQVSSPLPLSSFPNNSRLLFGNRTFIKIDNDTLYEISDNNRTSAKFTNTNIIFNYDTNNLNNFVKLNTLGTANAPALFTTTNRDTVENRSFQTTSSIHADIIINNNKYVLWIPNGDVYSYYTNLDESIAKIRPKAFCPASLYQTYNSCYHRITLDNIKDFEKRQLNIARCYKDFAKYLATSPYTDEFSISRLSNKKVRDITNNYILDTNLQNALIKTVKYLESKNLIDNLNNNLNNNIISNIRDLKLKIIQKYGLKLQLSGSGSISTKRPLEHGADVVINQVASYLVDKNINNTSIFANQLISVGGLVVRTDFKDQDSKISFIGNSSPRTNSDITSRENVLDENSGGIARQRPLYAMNAFMPKIKNSIKNKINIVMEKTCNIPGHPESENPLLPNSPLNILFKFGDFSGRRVGTAAYAQIPSLYTNLIKFNVIVDDFELETYKYAEDPFAPSDMIAKDYIQCQWEQVSGPHMFFVDHVKAYISPKSGPLINISSEKITDISGYNIATNIFIGSTEAYIWPSSIGRYQIKCTIKTPYGTFVKIKTFYVTGPTIDDIKSVVPPGTDIRDIGAALRSLRPGGGDPKNDVAQFIPDPTDQNYILQKEVRDIYLNKDNLRVFVPKLNRIALNANGLCWPVDTNLYIKKNRKRPQLLVNLPLYQFVTNGTGSSGSSTLLLQYDLNNTKYRLEKIILENTRNNIDPKCADCFSFYLPQLYSQGSTWYRTKGDIGGTDNAFSLIGVSKDDGLEQILRYYILPPISTDYSPPIKSYGGYDRNILDTLDISSIPDHASPGQILPAITGRPLNYSGDSPGQEAPFGKKKYCFEDYLPASNSNYLSFDKGVFHPQSGWIPHDSIHYNDVKNLSSVLKFNPGARDSFSFTGPSITNLNNEGYIVETGVLYILPKKCSSKISLGVARQAQFIPYLQPCQTDQADCRPDPPPEWEWLNQLHRDATDQYPNVTPGINDAHGYRILGGGMPKQIEKNNNSSSNPVMDEFHLTIDQNNNLFNYLFTQSGPAYPISPMPDQINNFLQKLTRPQDTNSPEGDARNCVGPDGSKPQGGYYKGIPDPTDTWQGIRNPRVLDFTIQDLEVKLNFLNYVNTKDITISFTLAPCTDEFRRICSSLCSCFGGGSLDSAIKPGSNNFIDQTITDTLDGPRYLFGNGYNTYENFIDTRIGFGGSMLKFKDSTLFVSEYSSLDNYLRFLTIMNTVYNPLEGTDGLGENVLEPQILYLLNQEYIQNHSVNLNLTFSDNANKYNVLHDKSFAAEMSGVASIARSSLRYGAGTATFDEIDVDNRIAPFYKKQYIISNNDMIRPTTSTNYYSDRQGSLYHNIITTNKLNIVNNTFAKYRLKPLFTDSTCTDNCGRGVAPVGRPRYSSQTVFSLDITVYDESDDMSPLNNTVSSMMFTNAYDFTGKINTSQFDNSLCSWDLLLHVGNTVKPTVSNLSSCHSYGNNEALALIDYSNKPKYPGYSFIANLRNHKHLLPFVNINAPNIFFYDHSICQIAKLDQLGSTTPSYLVDFPTNAILNILTIMAGVAGMSGAGLIGINTGIAGAGPGLDAAYGSIISYFNDIRLSQYRSDIAQDVFHQDYSRYPFGSPEKILINFSKDGIFWYKAEASIFKYGNTPVLSTKKYSYIKLNKNSFPLLSRFTFDFVTDIRDLIDDKYIKTLSLPCDRATSLVGPITYNNISYNRYDLVDISFTIDDESNTTELCKNGIYSVTDNQWVLLSGNPLLINSNLDYISDNSVLVNHYNGSSISSIFSNFTDSILNNQIIILDGKIPYEIFSFNDNVEVSGNNLAPDPIIEEPTGPETTPGLPTGDSTPTTPTPPQPSGPTYTRKVIGKGLIYKDTKPYSILKMDRSMSGVEFISPQNNVAVIFDLSLSYDTKYSPLNQFSFEKEYINTNYSPEVFKTTHSIGSYGDGSNFRNKNILNTIPSYNNIKKLDDILNNHINDKLKEPKIIINDNIKLSLSSIGYPHKITDIPEILNQKNYIVQENNLNDSIKNQLENIINNIESTYSLYYIKNNDFKKSNIPLTGVLTVEDDFELQKIVTPVNGAGLGDNTAGQQISDAIYNNLIDRLNILEDQRENSSLEGLVGIKNNTNIILQSRNLKYIHQHLTTLVDYDDNQKRTEYVLSTLYKERDDILRLLNEISTKQTATITLNDSSNSIIIGDIIFENIDYIEIKKEEIVQKIEKNNIKYIRRTFTRNISNIRGQEIANISLIKPFRWMQNIDIYDITYEKNNDDYWINLDPYQSCSIAEELRPKVLKKIEYICRPANFNQSIGGSPLLPSNNICMRFRGQSIEGKDGDSVTFKKGNKAACFGTPIYESHIYEINKDIINSKKNDLENKLTEQGLPIYWKEWTSRRDYHINGIAISDTVSFERGQDILVTAFETYDILLTELENAGGKIVSSSRSDGDVNTFGENGIKELPELPGGGPRESRGYGLLYPFGRIDQSVRIYNVCNLDNTNNLKIKIRKLPRLLRGIDMLSTVFRYGIDVPYRPYVARDTYDPLDPCAVRTAGQLNSGFNIINNDFHYWKCMEIDNNTNTLIPSSTPPFFKLMNEMMYRVFYGSVDGIEIKTNDMISQFLWELIPYEFFTKPPTGDDAAT